MADAAYEYLDRILDRLQQSERIRRLLAVTLVVALASVAGMFLYDLLPREYRLTITGGSILSNRHHLAKVLQEEASNNGLLLDILPIQGSLEALSKVNDGAIDLAIVQGGLDTHFAHVQHVATLMPELIHVLVRPGIATVADLHGKVISLGSLGGGTHAVATQVLQFSGLESGIHYVEVNHSPEELLALRPDRLPDAVVNVSTVPSYLADFLVRERGYHLLEMPFPQALALRLGWVADAAILGYTYSVSPAVPERTISAIGVNLHIVANDNVEPRAIFALLSRLYSPAVAARFNGGFDESRIMAPPGFPVADGTARFLDRDKPFLSAEMWEHAHSTFGLVMSVLSTLLVVYKWLRGAPARTGKGTAG